MKRLVLSSLSLLCLCSAILGFDTRPEPVAPDGTRAPIDLPASQHMTNVGGSDGAGLCVPTSVTVAARWQNVQDFFGFRKFAEGRPGGSYPEKLAADLKLYATRNAVKLPDYVQHTGGDESFLDLCVATRRMPGVTYAGLDGFYDSGIAHMVDLAALDKTHGAIIDNNRAGSWVWGTRGQVVNRWKGLDDSGKPILVPFRQGIRTVWAPVGGGWAFCWLGPPPPPKPPVVSEAITGPAKSAGPVRVWERGEAEDGSIWWLLYENGQLIWAVDSELKWHRAVGPGEWERDTMNKPEGLAAPTAPEPTQSWNNGIDTERIGSAHRYWLNDVECTRAKAFAAVADPLGAGVLSDDSDRYHLSVVGDRATVSALLAPGGPLEKYSRRVHLQVYAASDWPTKDRLSSVVTLQEPAKIGGKIVGTASRADADGLRKVLGDVFDPPAPVVPQPTPPKPVAPAEPAPAPQPAPTPGPIVPPVLQLILAAVAAWLAAHGLTRTAKETK